jgi:Protein of unknown function (DUF2946)
MKIWRASRRGEQATGIRPWLLSLLCVLASMAYLTRQIEPGKMGDTKMVVSSLAPIEMDAEQMDMSAGEMGAGQIGQPHSAPHSPAHNHSGHCPFCFTAAFSLVAETARVHIQTAALASAESFAYVLPDVLTARHAEARAPPLA